MEQIDLFPNLGIPEEERLYIVGNGFDLHHYIKSRYSDFRKWAKNSHSDITGMMDEFFSNSRDFWRDIETALGEYKEEDVTKYCEPENPEDFKYEHSGIWQAGIEDSITYIFGSTMTEFKKAFNGWVKSIDISNVKADLFLPTTSKYLTFNYTETLEKCYDIPSENVIHIHGSRLDRWSEFIIGHNNPRDVRTPFRNDSLWPPYQEAQSEVISTMNGWVKDTNKIISAHRDFFNGLSNCKAVCVMGFSYNDVDMPYLEKVVSSVATNCKWMLCYYEQDDKKRAEEESNKLFLNDYELVHFE